MHSLCSTYCTICDKFFSSKQKRLSHINTHHSGIEVPTLDLSPKDFITRFKNHPSYLKRIHADSSSIVNTQILKTENYVNAPTIATSPERKEVTVLVDLPDKIKRTEIDATSSEKNTNFDTKFVT